MVPTPVMLEAFLRPSWAGSKAVTADEVWGAPSGEGCGVPGNVLCRRS